MLSHFLQNTKERGAIHDSPTLIYALTGIAHTCKETSFLCATFCDKSLYIPRAYTCTETHVFGHFGHPKKGKNGWPSSRFNLRMLSMFG